MLKQIDRRGRFHLVALATLALLACGSAEARRQQVSGPPPAVPPLDSALAGVPLDPNWPKHVYVITDSVMLGAKQPFINALPDWQVTFDGRPAIQIRQALKEYTLSRRDTGPVAVVALGYNTLWEKDRHNFKRWSDMFDKHVEEMLTALKERGARKIVWVMLRELTPEMITTGGVSQSQYNRYAWYFPYVNERLKAIKERHPEMGLADWAGAAKVSGVTYDAIHLNGRGADLMVEVVKTAMGVYGGPSATPQTVVARPPAQAPAPSIVAAAEPPRAEPVRVEPGRRVVATVLRRAEAAPPPPAEPVRVEPARIETAPARVEPPRVEETHATTPRKKPSYRGHRQEMFAMSRFEAAPVVMLGDSLTERAQWGEITGCGFIANRGIGGDDSAGVLRRLDAVVRLRPGAVFMMIGVNDLISNVPSDRIVDNVRETIGRLTQSGAKVYLTLVLPVTHGFTRKVNARVDDLNAAYIKLAAETNATLVDFRADMQNRAGFLRDDLSIDGIHLSPEGYRVWRDAVAPLVARHCSQAGDLVAQAAPPKLMARVPQSADLPVAQAAPQPVAQPTVQPTQRVAVADVTASIPARPAMRGAWIIQVGAYPEEEKAQERIRQAQDLGRDLLANADPFTEKVVKGSRELYRARFAGFNQGAAEAACSYFKRNSIDCISMKR
jgi:lysophospholipase L1-like esterase